MAHPTRRHFLVVAASAAGCSLLVLNNVAQGARPKPTGADAILDAGPVGDYAKEGLYDQFVKDHKVFICRKGDALYAVSAVCTHKDQVLRKREKEGDIYCKAHGSTFDLDGTNAKGKASLSLPRHRIELKDGKVVVDRSVEFYEKDYDKDGASLKLPATA